PGDADPAGSLVAADRPHRTRGRSPPALDRHHLLHLGDGLAQPSLDAELERGRRARAAAARALHVELHPSVAEAGEDHVAAVLRHVGADLLVEHAADARLDIALGARAGGLPGGAEGRLAARRERL